MRYIILAGGLGTRLQTVITSVPKPMAPIDGRPFLEILLEYLLKYNAEGFILCVSHKREAIMDYFGYRFGGVPINYSIEDPPLGTGGAIVKAFRDNHVKEAIAVNGDTLIKADYVEFAKISSKSSLGLMLVQVEDTNRYGRVEIKNNKIVRFLEKGFSRGPCLINAGSYWLTDSIVKSMPGGAFSLEKDFLEPRLPQLEPSYFVTSDYFIDIGLPETYYRAKMELTQISANSKCYYQRMINEHIFPSRVKRHK